MSGLVRGRYRITSELGRGGLGASFLAEDTHRGGRVVLKRMELLGVTDRALIDACDADIRRRSGLVHPAIARYVDHFIEDGPDGPIFNLVEELVEGRSLEAWIRAGYRPPEDDVRRVVIELLDALVFLHRQRPAVLHRDVSPRNVIVRPDGHVVLVDFGASVRDAYRAGMGAGQTLVSAFGYLAPEQHRGVAVPATDLYGLGGTVVTMLSGKSPADLPQSRLRLDVRAGLPNVTPRVQGWLERCLEPEPEHRYPTAEAALTGLSGDGAVHGKRSGGRGRVVVALLLLFVAALGAAGYLYRGPILRHVRPHLHGGRIQRDRMGPNEQKAGQPRQSPSEPEDDLGYGESHGYGPSHGGPTGPGDAPADPSIPSGAPSAREDDEDALDES